MCNGQDELETEVDADPIRFSMVDYFLGDKENQYGADELKDPTKQAKPDDVGTTSHDASNSRHQVTNHIPGLPIDEETVEKFHFGTKYIALGIMMVPITTLISFIIFYSLRHTCKEK